MFDAYKEAPWGYNCPYKNACPHLGMSTTWALLEINDARKQKDNQGLRRYETDEYVKALERKNRELEAENQDLRARLRQQHRLKFKKNKKAPGPPTDSLPRKRGAPLGHSPWQRATPERIDRTIYVEAPPTCPHCNHEGLEPTGNIHSQIQEDIVLQPRTIVTKYNHQKAYCPVCRREVFKTAGAGAVLYENLRNKVRAAHIIHGDETHWRIDGKSAQLWYAGNRDFDFFHADYSRGSEVAASIFGTAFGGYLNADSYAGYNIINPLGRQVCLAHIKRKADEIAERIQMLPKQKQDQRSLHFCRALSRLTSHCCKLGHKRNSGRLAFKMARALIPKLEQMRDGLCANPLKDEDAENLRKRISLPDRDRDRLFVFLNVNGMEPTNNHAEQALRLPVIFRKISFGSRSLHGAQSLAVNLSLLGTANRQNRDSVELKTLLLNRSDTPPEKLFNPEKLPELDSS